MNLSEWGERTLVQRNYKDLAMSYGPVNTLSVLALDPY